MNEGATLIAILQPPLARLCYISAHSLTAQSLLRQATCVAFASTNFSHLIRIDLNRLTKSAHLRKKENRFVSSTLPPNLVFNLWQFHFTRRFQFA